MSDQPTKRAIWKYPILAVNEPFEIMMPVGAQILSTAFDVRTTKICVWAMVNPDEKNMVPKHVILYATGHVHDVPTEEQKFIGLAVINIQVKKSNLALPGGNEIQHVIEYYHVYEIINKN